MQVLWCKMYTCTAEVCCAAFETAQLKMNALDCFLGHKFVHRKYTGTQTNSSNSFELFQQGHGNQYICFPQNIFSSHPLAVQEMGWRELCAGNS